MTDAPEQQERPSRTELGRFLLESGTMAPDWADAFEAVPRSWFLPDVMWPLDLDMGEHRVVDKQGDPDAWFRWADTNAPITTQWDDGHHDGPGPGTVSTSSSSMPSLVFSMLGDLDVGPGMSVLEIGAGTGWSGALLTHRVGPARVTTVEIDPSVAAHARARLERAGSPTAVVQGDGLLGYPANAPYDRVIATVGVRDIPFAWVEQTRPGGIILAPWGTDYTSQDAAARLLVADDGDSASGRFTEPMSFMKMRSQRLEWPRHDEYVGSEWPGDAEVSATTLRMEEVFDGPYGAADFVVGLTVPACAHVLNDQGDGTSAAWFYGLADRSWAAVHFTEGDDESEVFQSGPRRLWDEVESAWNWWNAEGRPAVERFGLTVTAQGQYTWLDDPGTPVGPPPVAREGRQGAH